MIWIINIDVLSESNLCRYTRKFEKILRKNIINSMMKTNDLKLIKKILSNSNRVDNETITLCLSKLYELKQRYHDNKSNEIIISNIKSEQKTILDDKKTIYAPRTLMPWLKKIHKEKEYEYIEYQPNEELENIPDSAYSFFYWLKDHKGRKTRIRELYNAIRSHSQNISVIVIGEVTSNDTLFDELEEMEHHIIYSSLEEYKEKLGKQYCLI